MNDDQLVVRPLRGADDLAAITALIHAAYARHAAGGLRFWGTHQTVADTTTRFASGAGLVAERNGQLVGTLTVHGPQPDSPFACYRDAGTWGFTQFAVAPAQRGHGVGAALHRQAIALARAGGAHRMTIDTAAPALGLIALYERWGYTVCGECDRRPLTNYLSTVMSRPLHPGADV